MNYENTIYDVVIGGQGAAAFAAGMYAARYQMSAIIVGTTFGGETATGGLIENYPGYPDIDGFDLMMKFREHAEKYNVPIIDDKLVISNVNGTSQKESGVFQIAGESDQIYRGRSVILAIGRERRSLWLDHEQDWTGRGVSYCSTCDAPMHKGNTVAVVGGGDSAVKGSVLISKYADKVYLIYRKSNFTRPEAANLRQLDAATNIERVFNTNVIELLGDDAKGLTGIKLDNSYKNQDALDVDGLFIEIGADPRKELPLHLGAKVNESDEVIVDKFMNTNVSGLIAAGDLTDASGDLKQTITAAAQGSMAATTAYEYVSNL
ncbi:MAG: thioredoxin reductase (NADPH) [Chloroflexi bacterium]|jgi:thioredoxin reductase (NADPH)|nr:MAG: thioredoxin reductase (NADPH) [Chloroflexota bacterium]